jgi:hypothetical protein
VGKRKEEEEEEEEGGRDTGCLCLLVFDLENGGGGELKECRLI